MKSRSRAPWRAACVGLLDDAVGQLIAVRAGDVEVHAEHRRRVGERRRHVVAVADKRHRPAAQGAPAFPHRQTVGHGLARMLVVGERVDDMETLRARGELLECPVRERSDDHRVDPALEVARDVGHRLALAERHVGLQSDGAAAELANATSNVVRVRRDDFSNSIATWRPLSAARSAPRAQRAVGLEPRRQLESALEVAGVHIENREEVLAPPGSARYLSLYRLHSLRFCSLR